MDDFKVWAVDIVLRDIDTYAYEEDSHTLAFKSELEAMNFYNECDEYYKKVTKDVTHVERKSRPREVNLFSYKDGKLSYV